LNLFSIILIVVFTLVQCRISIYLLRGASARLSGRRLLFARIGVYLFDIAAVLGYCCTWSDLMSRLELPNRPTMLYGAVTTVYLLIGTVLLGVHEVVRKVKSSFAADMDPGRRRALETAGNFVMAAPLAAMGYGSFIQRTDFHVREIDVPVAGLAPDLENLKILQLSDIHLSAFLSESEFSRVVDAATGIRAHIAVITGDLISGRGDPLDACIRQLARVKADAGVFGCMGNHERYAAAEDYAEKASRRVGIEFLRSQAQQLRFGNSVLSLAGVDYQSRAGKKEYLRGAGSMIVPGACNVLLSHNPDVFPVAAEQGYNLLLAGHTHGGQVNVEILDQSINPARFVTPFIYGIYRERGSTAFVTRGIGTIGIPTRLGAPPEICVLRLRKA